MSFAISNDIRIVMMTEAERSYPNEACGFIVAKGKKSVPIVCHNVAEIPQQQFRISSEEYAKAADQGEIIAVWHTHVNLPPAPSDADKASCEMMGMPYLIQSIFLNEDGDKSFSDIQLLEPTGFEMPYLERPYVFGVFDCWTLVRDYYKREYGITLSEFPRIDKFWQKGYDLFGENWAKEGFAQLIGEEPKVGDLFLMQTDSSGKINHIGIYIGNEMMLHHAHGRLSRRDIYGGYWLKHTSHHIRYKDFMTC